MAMTGFAVFGVLMSLVGLAVFVLQIIATIKIVGKKVPGVEIGLWAILIWLASPVGIIMYYAIGKKQLENIERGGI